MKKVLVILMTLAMVVSCFAGFAVSSSAAELEYVEESYKYVEAAEADFGTQEIDDTGAIKGEYTLGTYWTHEWLDVASGVFYPMGAYFTAETGAGLCSWTNSYSASVDASLIDQAATYCNIRNNGTAMHPGNGAGSTLTFIAPATGVISFEASVFPYGSGNTSDSENGGDSVYLYLNDKKVWPETEEDAVMYYDTASKSDPKVASLSSFEVNAGDKVRFVITCKPGTTRAAKGCTVVDLPVVTYHSAKKADGSALPVGNPNGEPPVNVLTTDATIEGCKVTWDAAKNAKGYNLYIAGEKVNTELVTETTYTITGLEHKTLYEVTVTTVTNNDKESEPSAPVSFRTKKDPDATITTTTTDTTSEGGNDTTTDTSSQAPVTTTNKVDAPAEDNSMLWIIIAAAAAAVVVIVVVVVVISKKKKA
ncbi:MAG: fibronectin type III domain-containing protein [Clostridia bacterium]|nr:fibronectin type III domain-containing protein [Clostridia bacterium]